MADTTAAEVARRIEVPPDALRRPSTPRPTTLA
jgi:hypothetical protein